MKALIKSALVIICAAVAGAGCTVKKQEAPPLTGPSEFGTSITISVSPDILPTDGGSQSLVTITARDANGQPLRNLSLRTEILVDGAVADFGSLSARNVVTDASGRATVVYTAPSVSSSVDPGLQVAIAATPIGTDAANSVPRTAVIRLVPVGTVIGPSGLQPTFTFAPSSPTVFETIFFDASASTSSPSNPITSYRWDFGDGTTLFGRQVSKSFSTPGNMGAQLTIFDAAGRSASFTRSVTVAPLSTTPFALFDFSPDDPRVNETVFFTAARSTVPQGRRIVRYEWDFGNGQTATGLQTSTSYSAARTYTVVLTITDDLGRTSSSRQTVTVE